MTQLSIGLACAVLLFACGEDPPARAPSPPAPAPEVVPQPAEPPPPEPGRAVWIDPSGAVRETRPSADAPIEAWGEPHAGISRIHAVLARDRIVVGEPAEAELPHERVSILARSGEHIEVGLAQRVMLSPNRRFLVMERGQRAFYGGGVRTEVELSAFDLEARSARPIGMGSFIAFDERGRAISVYRTHDVGPNDAPRNHRTFLQAAPMPGEPMAGPAPELVPIVGPEGAVAYLDVPSPFGSGACTLHLGAAEIPIRGRVCSRVTTIAWAPDASAIALIGDDGVRATLRVISRDGRELGAYDAGPVDPDPYAPDEGRLDFSSDASELAIRRPDGAIVRVSKEGRALGEIGSGSLRGYDHSGRYVLTIDRERRARIVDTRGSGARDLGPAADAAWLPP